MKKVKTFPFLLILAGLPLLVACGGGSRSTANGDESIDLKFNPEKGATYATVTKTSQDIEMENMGQQMNIKQDITFETSVNVAEQAENGNYKIRSVYDRISIKQSIPGMGALGENEFDTKDPKSAKGMMAAMLGETFSKLIGIGVTNEMSAKGEVLNTDNSEVMEKAGQDGANNTNSNFSTFGAVFKGAPIKVGESWESNVSTTVEQTQFTTSTTYTLTGIENNVATLTVNGIIKPQVIEGDKSTGEEASIEGTQSGTIKIDIASGWTLASDIKQDLKMQMTQNGQKIPMKIKSSITVESQKK